jgi:hypothetical protein
MEINIRPLSGGWLFQTPKVPDETWSIMTYPEDDSSAVEYWDASSGTRALGRYDNPFQASEAVRADMQRRIQLGVLERLSRTDTAEELLTAFKAVIGSLEYYADLRAHDQLESWPGEDEDGGDPIRKALKTLRNRIDTVAVVEAAKPDVRTMITQGRALINKIEEG